MAYNIPAGSIAEFTIRGLIDDQQTITTFHYRNAATQADGRQAILDAFVDFESFVWMAYQPLASFEWGAVFLQGQWIFPTRFQPVTFDPTEQAGANATPTCPSGVAVVSRRKGDTANRKSQGRVYWPGIPFASVTDSHLTVAWMEANAQNVANANMAFLNLPDTSQLEPVIWSHQNPNDPVDITNAAVDSVLRYQRRRELRVGI